MQIRKKIIEPPGNQIIIVSFRIIDHNFLKEIFELVAGRRFSL